jgi:hypothetical protein
MHWSVHRGITVSSGGNMARFDTDHILTIISTDALRDHETNRQVA